MCAVAFQASSDAGHLNKANFADTFWAASPSRSRAGKSLAGRSYFQRAFKGFEDAQNQHVAMFR